jgi:chromosome segregation ATPase
MAAGSAPDNKETVYNTRVLSKWFAISSIFLLVVVVWAAIQDYARPWKVYQRQAQSIATAINERKLLEADKAMNRTQLEKLEKEIAEIEERKAQVVREIDAKIKAAEAVLYSANKTYQDEKGKLDEEQYGLEMAIAAQNPRVGRMTERFEQNRRRVTRLARVEERERLNVEALQATRRDILSKQLDVESQLSSLMRSRDNILKAIESTELSLVNIARNAPLLDFVAPTIKVNQVILNGLYDDYFFNKVPRVDRCMTCHVNADKAGFEDFSSAFHIAL